jgi:hypothetical protein
VVTKNKRKVDLGLHAIPLQHQADETTVCHTPSHEEIRRRAYEVYLERGDLPGDELDDWLRAERELHKVALFARDWNRVQQRVAPTPKTEIDIRHMETKESGNQ